jgi:hypothetical protein
VSALDAVPPRKTASRQSAEDSPTAEITSPCRQPWSSSRPSSRITGAPAANQPAQSQGPPAVTSESRPLHRRITLHGKQLAGRCGQSRRQREPMPLSLIGFAERRHVARAPGSSGVKTPASTEIRPRRNGPATTPTATSPGTVPNTHRSADKTLSRPAALKTFHLAVCPPGRRAAAKSGLPDQVDRGWTAPARTRPQVTGAAALLAKCRDMPVFPRLWAWMPRSCRWSSLSLSQWPPETGGLVPETGLRAHRHHQHHGPDAPGQLERHETPDPVRSHAVNPGFQCVRQQADRHDRHEPMGTLRPGSGRRPSAGSRVSSDRSVSHITECRK